MSIAILTVPFNYNYGGYLQAYALATVVGRLSGEQVVILNRTSSPQPAARKLRHFVKTAAKRLMGRKTGPLTLSGVIRRRREPFEDFITEAMPMVSEPVTDTARMCEALARYDVRLVIIGSDQVWRPIYVPEIEDYFGRFAHQMSVPVITYAASMGSTAPEYSDASLAACAGHYAALADVSVREDAAVCTLASLGFVEREVTHVLDPTLLLDRADYEAVMAHDGTEGQALCYTLDLNEPTPAMIEYLRGKTPGGVKVIYLTKSVSGRRNAQLPTPQRWLRDIHDAPFVLTDSYHGTIFSIIMHRPFAVLDNPQRGSSRFASLLSMLGLESRMVSTVDDLRRVMDEPIDWEAVERCRGRMRAVSLQFLQRNIDAVASNVNP